MLHRLATAPTFSLDRAIAFLSGFPPCQGEVVLGAGSIRGAFALGDRAVPYTVTAGPGATLVVDTPERGVVPLVAAFLSVDDDLTAFYASAASDVPAYRAIVDAHRGLHHVRFRTLEEVTVHAVLGQRTPIELASKQKRQVATALGPSVASGGATLRAFPTFARLVQLDERDWYAIVANTAKARRLPAVVRGVEALGADWLRTAPYPAAVSALEAIDGVGPFSAAMILLRGLGRMDDVPLDLPGIARVAEAVYGPTYDPDRIRARYGTDLGYWSFYLKVGGERGAGRGRLRPETGRQPVVRSQRPAQRAIR